MPSPLSRLEFASYLIFPTSSESTTGRQAKLIVNAIKEDRRYSRTQTYSQRAAERLRSEIDAGALQGFSRFLNPNRLLVPVPRAGLLREGALWPAKRIAECLVGESLGHEVLPYIRRVEGIPSSRLSGRGNRPPLDTKYQSLGYDEDERPLMPPDQITVVDDAISTGATIFSVAMRLAEAFPDTEVLAFGIARVRGEILEPNDWREPHIGLIESTGEWSVRRDD